MTVLIFMVACIVIVIANIGLAIWVICRTRGLWRLSGALPFVLLLLVGGNILLGTWRDPMAHNLWPFELLAASIAGCLFSLGIIGLHALVKHLRAGKV